MRKTVAIGPVQIGRPHPRSGVPTATGQTLGIGRFVRVIAAIGLAYAGKARARIEIKGAAVGTVIQAPPPRRVLEALVRHAFETKTPFLAAADRTGPQIFQLIRRPIGDRGVGHFKASGPRQLLALKRHMH